MKITDVWICNFGSFYGEHHFCVHDRGLVFVCGDNQDEPKMNSNGAGKSTLFDAIDWCLFGEVPKGDHVDSVVNEEAGKNCSVICEVWDEETNEVGRITRTRKKAGLYFRHGNTNEELDDLTAMDTNVTQAKIENFLGLDRKVYHAAVYRAQGDEFDFANSKDSEKKELLSRIIPELQEVDMLREVTKKKLAVAQTVLADKSALITTAEHQLEGFRKVDWAAREAEWEAQKEARRADVLREIEQVQSSITEFASQLVQEESLRVRVQELQAKPPQDLEYEARHALTAHQEKVSEFYTHLTVLQNETQQANQKRQALNQVAEGKCSRCGQDVTGEHLAAERKDLEAIYAEKQKARAAAETQYQQLLESQTFLRSRADAEEQRNSSKLSTHQQEIGSCQARLQNLMQLKAAKERAETDLLRRQGMLEVIDAEVWPAAPEKARHEDEIQKWEERLATLKQEQSDVTTRIQYLEFWAKAFGLQGLKSFILDSRLEDMTAAANTWVKILTGGTHWVRFESQTLNRSGKLAEQVNVRVFRYNPDGSISDRNYKSYSGGEKKRVALGVDWGLSCLVASRASKQWSLYVTDESFRQHIDSGGRESIFDLLEQLQKDRSSIYVVDHDLEMRAHFEHVITIQRKNQRSTILEEAAQQVAA